MTWPALFFFCIFLMQISSCLLWLDLSSYVLGLNCSICFCFSLGLSIHPLLKIHTKISLPVTGRDCLGKMKIWVLGQHIWPLKDRLPTQTCFLMVLGSPRNEFDHLFMKFQGNFCFLCLGQRVRLKLEEKQSHIHWFYFCWYQCGTF